MAKGVFILFFALTMALLIASVYCKMVEEASAPMAHMKNKVHDAAAPIANDAAAPKPDHAKRKASHAAEHVNHKTPHTAEHVKHKGSHAKEHGKHKTPDATETAEEKVKTTYDDETGSSWSGWVKDLFTRGFGKKKGSGSKKGTSYAPAPAPGTSYAPAPAPSNEYFD